MLTYFLLLLLLLLLLFFLLLLQLKISPWTFIFFDFLTISQKLRQLETPQGLRALTEAYFWSNFLKFLLSKTLSVCKIALKIYWKHHWVTGWSGFQVISQNTQLTNFWKTVFLNHCARGHRGWNSKKLVGQNNCIPSLWLFL